MSERDGAWMARIIAQFSDAHLQSLVAIARLENPRLEAELLRLLGGRRDRVLERYLTRLSPLAAPRLEGGTPSELCLRDLAELGGVRREHTRGYAVTAYVGGVARRIEPVRARAAHRVCAELPHAAGASPVAPAYLVVDWVSQSEGFAPEFPARVHLFDLGVRGFAVVGLERPESFDPPG
jgi:hypothetical protein